MTFSGEKMIPVAYYSRSSSGATFSDIGLQCRYQCLEPWNKLDTIALCSVSMSRHRDPATDDIQAKFRTERHARQVCRIHLHCIHLLLLLKLVSSTICRNCYLIIFIILRRTICIMACAIMVVMFKVCDN